MLKLYASRVSVFQNDSKCTYLYEESLRIVALLTMRAFGLATWILIRVTFAEVPEIEEFFQFRKNT